MPCPLLSPDLLPVARGPAELQVSALHGQRQDVHLGRPRHQLHRRLHLSEEAKLNEIILFEISSGPLVICIVN